MSLSVVISMNDMLYVADRDGGTSDDDPSVAVVRQLT